MKRERAEDVVSGEGEGGVKVFMTVHNVCHAVCVCVCVFVLGLTMHLFPAWQMLTLYSISSPPPHSIWCQVHTHTHLHTYTHTHTNKHLHTM